MGAFIMVSAVIAFWFAPMSAEPASKAARNALMFTLDRRQDPSVRLEFKHEPLAEVTQRSL